MTPQDDGSASTPEPRHSEFEPLAALDDLLSEVELSRGEAGATVSFTGQDPILPAAHRLGACIGIPIMASAVAALAFHRQRRGPAQDVSLDPRQAVHHINPGAFWRPTLDDDEAGGDENKPSDVHGAGAEAGRQGRGDSCCRHHRR